MILWRLCQDWHGLPEGACVSEAAYRGVYYTDKVLFEPVQDYERADMIEYKDENFCREMNIECLLFYSTNELDRFVNKQYENGIVD